MHEKINATSNVIKTNSFSHVIFLSTIKNDIANNYLFTDYTRHQERYFATVKIQRVNSAAFVYILNLNSTFNIFAFIDFIKTYIKLRLIKTVKYENFKNLWYKCENRVNQIKLNGMTEVK